MPASVDTIGRVKFGTRRRSVRQFAVLFVVLSGSALSLHALAVGPEPNARVLQWLRDLPPGRGVVLGDARVEGEFNPVAREYALDRTGPRGRDFSVKMVWSPERGTAWFLGANHGSPHRLNDVWEFDLASLTWRLAYAPDNPRSYAGMGKDASDVVFRDGVLQTLRGGPAVIGHTWWGLTYDDKSRQIIYMNTWATDQEKVIRELGGNPDARYRGAPLWTFSPASSSWTALRPGQPFPRAPFAGLLEYVPVLDGVVWHSNHWQMRATWLYSTTSGGWRKLTEHGTAVDYVKDLPAQEQVGYYDPRRAMLVVMRGGRVAHFDVARNHWAKVLDLPKDSADAPDAHDARTPIYYDPVSGHGLLFDLKDDAVWSYDPDAKHWSRQAVSGDPVPQGKKRLSYFDPRHNVLVVIDGVKVWAYRYRAPG